MRTSLFIEGLDISGSSAVSFVGTKVVEGFAVALDFITQVEIISFDKCCYIILHM